MNFGKYSFGVRKSKLIASTLRIGKARAQNTFELHMFGTIDQSIINRLLVWRVLGGQGPPSVIGALFPADPGVDR